VVYSNACCLAMTWWYANTIHFTVTFIDVDAHYRNSVTSSLTTTQRLTKFLSTAFDNKKRTTTLSDELVYKTRSVVGIMIHRSTHEKQKPTDVCSKSYITTQYWTKTSIWSTCCQRSQLYLLNRELQFKWNWPSYPQNWTLVNQIKYSIQQQLKSLLGLT